MMSHIYLSHWAIFGLNYLPVGLYTVSSHGPVGLENQAVLDASAWPAFAWNWTEIENIFYKNMVWDQQFDH